MSHDGVGCAIPLSPNCKSKMVQITFTKFVELFAPGWVDRHPANARDIGLDPSVQTVIYGRRSFEAATKSIANGHTGGDALTAEHGHH